jgi:hypothetical protein
VFISASKAFRLKSLFMLEATVLARAIEEWVLDPPRSLNLESAPPLLPAQPQSPQPLLNHTSVLLDVFMTAPLWPMTATLGPGHMSLSAS